MNRIDAITDKLYEKFSDWEELWMRGDGSSKQIEELMYELINEVRGFYIEHGQGPAREVCQGIFHVEEAGKKFWNRIEMSLSTFHNVEALREIEKKDIIRGKMILDGIFDRGILRIEIGLFDQFEQFDLKDEESFADLIISLKDLTFYYVKKNWSDSSIYDDFKDETQFSDQFCHYFVSLFNKYRQEIFNVILMEQLSEIENRIRTLEEKMKKKLKSLFDA